MLVNGQRIGWTENMHHQHTFEVPGALLHTRNNTLRVELVSPLVWARAQHGLYGHEHAKGIPDSDATWCRPGGHDYRVFLRKEVSSFFLSFFLSFVSSLVRLFVRSFVCSTLICISFVYRLRTYIRMVCIYARICTICASIRKCK